MIFKILVFAFGLVLAVTLLKNTFPSGAIVLTIVGCVAVFMMSVSLLGHIGEALTHIGISGGVNSESVSVIAKTLGVAYLTSFGTDVCNDAGERALANAVETTGKIIMLSLAFPMLGGIFKSVVNIIG